MWLEGVLSVIYYVYVYNFEREGDVIYEGLNGDKEYMELVEIFKII